MSKENINGNPAPLFQWKFQENPPQDFFDRFPDLHPVLANILFHRNILTKEEHRSFLEPDYLRDQHDPFLFQDMPIAIDRIRQAIEKKERVVIHGDYDADGVCGAAVLYLTLERIGCHADVYLPHRDTEGYGLNMHTIQNLADVGTDLIITVDCGISNKKEIEKASELGMDVIVTDHHSEPPELPDAAIAIINPKIEKEPYPFPYLAGVGVGFKVCQALLSEYDVEESFEKWLLDMVAVSTITDFVELVGENRIFVQYGLLVLKKNRRPGLRQLFERLKIDPATINTTTIGFKIGPPINAAGRVKHANQAFEMLIAPNDEEAKVIVAELERTNRQRQTLSRTMSDLALEQAKEQTDEQVLIILLDECPVGLVGLVAGKVSSFYGKPTFVITKMNNEIVGSGRSIEQFHLVEGLQSMDELFLKYGGHPMACGFSLKDEDALKEFIARFRQRAKEQLFGQDLRRMLPIEMTLSLADIDWDVVQSLESAAPYGQSNPEPVFVSKGVSVVDCQAVGKQQDHLKIRVSADSAVREGIAFGLGMWQSVLKKDDRIDIAYTISVNEWQGNKRIQLEIQDIQTV